MLFCQSKPSDFLPFLLTSSSSSWCYTIRFAATMLSATHRSNVGTIIISIIIIFSITIIIIIIILFYFYLFLITAIFNLIPSGLGASAEEIAVEQFLKDAVSVSDSLVRVVRKADSCKNNAVLKISGIVWTGPLMECGLAGFPRFEK